MIQQFAMATNSCYNAKTCDPTDGWIIQATTLSVKNPTYRKVKENRCILAIWKTMQRSAIEDRFSRTSH